MLYCNAVKVLMGRMSWPSYNTEVAACFIKKTIAATKFDKNAPMPKPFEARLKSTLVANAFYNTDEFMAFNWETLDWQTD
ncbi:hypothetical protein J6590_029842 [Homalodisca vitripennis]|nr:hypothetical protein J6590_029842 [Homalodisca vitripennis]